MKGGSEIGVNPKNKYSQLDYLINYRQNSGNETH